MTTKYTHFGLQDQAEALAGPPNPNAYTTADELGIGWVSSGALGQELAAAVGEADPDAGLRNEQTPDCSGGCVVFCRKLSAAGNLHRSGGGGNWHCKIIALVLIILQKGLMTFSVASANGISRPN